MGKEGANALKGKRVVVTRALGQSELLVKALRDVEAVPVVVPMVAFGAPDDVVALDAAIRKAGEFDWLLLTSQNALRALQERSEVLAEAFQGVGVAAVGPATADAARNAGLVVKYVAVKHRGVELAEELGEKIRGKKVFLPRSDRANPELVRKLEELGARVQEVVAYKTVLPDEGILQGVDAELREGADAVLFFSPSAVHHLRNLVGEERFQELSRRVVFAAIGPVTEDALRKAKAERVVMAEDTTVDAVITALNGYFMASGAKLPAGAN